MKTHKALLFVAALLSTLFLQACATNAKSDAMIGVRDPGTKPFPSELRNSISIGKIHGGQETNAAFGVSKIADNEFRDALYKSLQAAGLGANSDAPFSLEAQITGQDQPMMGFNMTATAHIYYKLVDKKTGKTIFREQVITSHTATVGDSFYAPNRIKLANEGAIRKNITDLLRKLSEIEIPKTIVKK